MRYASMEEMIRNIDKQIFCDKNNKVVMVYAKDFREDSIEYRHLVSPKITVAGKLSEVQIVCPPLGLFNTKDKDLVLLERNPRRQYQVGMSNNNTSCISITGKSRRAVDTVCSNPTWYEKMLCNDQFPSVDKAIELNKDKGYKAIAIGRYLYLMYDEEYDRYLINSYKGNVLASLNSSKQTWQVHGEPSIVKSLGVL